MTADGNKFDNQIIAIDSDIRTVPNGNNLSIMQLNRRLTIRLNDGLIEPWTVLFSTKLDEPLQNIILL